MEHNEPLSPTRLLSQPSPGSVSSGDDECELSDDATEALAEGEESHLSPRGSSHRQKHLYQTFLDIFTKCRPTRPRDDNDGPRSTPRGTLAMFMQSVRQTLFSSYLNILLVFVPIGVATYFIKAPPAWVFFTNAVAIVPLSSMLTDATERIAMDAGDTIGALLNISLGNLVELILLVALENGHTRIVESSILGSILVNILLILGSALLACSMMGVDSTYTAVSTQVLGSLLFISMFAFLMPTAFEATFFTGAESDRAVLKMSRITACVVLVIYVMYVLNELRQPSQVSSHSKARVLDVERGTTAGTLPTHATSPLVLPPRTIRFAEEDIIDDPDDALRGSSSLELDPVDDQSTPGIDHLDQERPSRARTRGVGDSIRRSIVSFRGHSRSLSHGSMHRLSRDSSLGSEVRRSLMQPALPTMRAMRSYDELIQSSQNHSHFVSPAIERTVAILVLIISSGLMSMNAEFLVSTIDLLTHEGGHLSESLIGLIILPIVGNIVEYITVVTVAVREKLDLAIAVSVGSSIQIALCVAPLTVLAGWIMEKDLALTFNFFEMASLAGTVLLVNIIILSESAGGTTSNALRGGLICGCYGIIGIGACLAA